MEYRGVQTAYRKQRDSIPNTGSNRSSIGIQNAFCMDFGCIQTSECFQSRIETVTDDNDLEEIYNTERHLLYVACTRARDHLLVTGVEPASEFLDDLKAASL